jgi:hypothetical protein
MKANTHRRTPIAIIREKMLGGLPATYEMGSRLWNLGWNLFFRELETNKAAYPNLGNDYINGSPPGEVRGTQTSKTAFTP